MTNSDIQVLETFILDELGRLHEVTTDQLLLSVAGSEEVRGFSPGVVTSVVWNLVSRGKVQWTANDNLALAA